LYRITGFIDNQRLAWVLLNFSVQKAIHLGRLPHSSVPGRIFCVVILLLTLATGSVLAGEPATILALNPSSEQDPAASFMQLVFGTNSLYFDLQNNQSTVVSFNAVKTDLYVPARQIEFQTNSIQDESFLLIRETSRSSKPVTVVAGYGQIWDDKSTLQKICSDYQDPGYAYVSARFSF
jgi:hypothetical protein